LLVEKVLGALHEGSPRITAGEADQAPENSKNDDEEQNDGEYGHGWQLDAPHYHGHGEGHEYENVTNFRASPPLTVTFDRLLARPFRLNGS
jgi:hypothetical protein